MNALFVGYKPTGLSSNQFLGRTKRKYGLKKAGYSGTLDPFAKGVLIIALGNATRLFRFLKKTPKTYRATLWLGAHSETLDIEKVEQIDTLNEFKIDTVKEALHTLQGRVTYAPPKYSAKKVDGKRAYSLARDGEEVILEPITSEIYNIKFISYMHPFVTFEATVSEGTYIRSLGQLLCQKLGVKGGCLSALERLSEGKFRYNNEEFLNIKEYLDMPKNIFLGERDNMLLGKKLHVDQFAKKEDSYYWIDNDDTVTIIEIKDGEMKYILNKVQTC
ncbi:MAG: tRNA pseudouridine(55) synthase TruB [Campylobacterota bacterium]|nr:tRNA pseudouridine(55) synthase TruB [Campylobacterota bacterium]